MAGVANEGQLDSSLSKEEGEITDDDETDESPRKERYHWYDKLRHRYDDRPSRTSSGSQQRDSSPADKYRGREGSSSRYRFPYGDSVRSETSTRRQSPPYRRASSRERDRYAAYSPPPRDYRRRDAPPPHTPSSTSAWRLRRFCPSSSDHNMAQGNDRSYTRRSDDTGSESSLRSDYEKLQKELHHVKELLSIMKAQEDTESSNQQRARRSDSIAASHQLAAETSETDAVGHMASVANSPLSVSSPLTSLRSPLSVPAEEKKEAAVGNIEGLSDISSQGSCPASPHSQSHADHANVVCGELSDVSCQVTDGFLDSVTSEQTKVTTLTVDSLHVRQPESTPVGVTETAVPSAINENADVKDAAENKVLDDEEELDELELRRIALASAAARFRMTADDDADNETSDLASPSKDDQIVTVAEIIPDANDCTFTALVGSQSGSIGAVSVQAPEDKQKAVCEPASGERTGSSSSKGPQNRTGSDTASSGSRVSLSEIVGKSPSAKTTLSSSNQARISSDEARKSSERRPSSAVSIPRRTDGARDREKDGSRRERSRERDSERSRDSEKSSSRTSNRSSDDRRESAKDRDSGRNRTRKKSDKSAPTRRPLPFAPVRLERIKLPSVSPKAGGLREAARKAQVGARQTSMARQLPHKPSAAKTSSSRARHHPRPHRASEEKVKKEEEHRKEEIAKILTLDDPQEQAERFLKLLSGALAEAATTKSQPTKDNYEEVEMDIDSNEETDDFQIEEFQTAMQPVQFLSSDPVPYRGVELNTIFAAQQWLTSTFMPAYTSYARPVSVQPPPPPCQPPPLPPLPADKDPQPPLPPSPPADSAGMLDQNSGSQNTPLSVPNKIFSAVSASEPSLQYFYFGRRKDEHIPFISDDVSPADSGAVGDLDVGVMSQSNTGYDHSDRYSPSDAKSPQDISAAYDPVDRMTTQRALGVNNTVLLTNAEALSPSVPDESTGVSDGSASKDSPLSMREAGHAAVDASPSQTAEEEEENEEELRAQLLRSLLTKRIKTESKEQGDSVDSSPSASVRASPQRLIVQASKKGASRKVSVQKTTSYPVFPIHKPVVVTLGESSSEDEEEKKPADHSLPLGVSNAGNLADGFDIDGFLKAQRKTVEEQSAAPHSQPAISPAPVPEAAETKKVNPEKQLHEHEIALSRQRQDIVQGQNTLQQLLSQASKFLAEMKKAEAKATHLREQLHTTERLIMRYRHLVHTSKTQAKEVKDSLLRKKEMYREAEQSAMSLGRQLHGLTYKPSMVNVETGIKRKVELATKDSELPKAVQPPAAKKQKVASATPPVDQSSKENIPVDPSSLLTADARRKEKERLQKLAEEYEERIRLLKLKQAQKNSQAVASVNTGQTGATQTTNTLAKKEKERLPSLETIKLEPVDVTVDLPGKPRRRSLLSITQSPKPNLLIKSENKSQDGGQVSAGKSKGAAEKAVASKIDFKMPSGVQLNNLCKIQREKMEKVLSPHSVGPPGHFPHVGPSFEPMAGLKLNLPGSRSAVKKEEEEDCHHPLAYSSPLVHFRAYRFSPYFRTKENLTISSPSFSHKLNPNRILCRYDLSGTCNDQHCQWQHVRDYSLSDKEVLIDLVSYSPQLAGVTEDDPPSAYAKKIESYVENLMSQHLGKMTTDHLCLLLTSRVSESAKHVRPHTMFCESRSWRLNPGESGSLSLSLTSQFQTPADTIEGIKRSPHEIDTVLDTEDIRYFVSDVSDTSTVTESADMEGAVLSTPSNTDLWLRLAYCKLSNPARSSEECLNQALNVLSRGLESNKHSRDLWVHYLVLYRKHPDSSADFEDLCQTAVHVAPCYDIWWQLLEASSGYQAKDSVCSRALDYLCSADDDKDSVPAELRSHQVLEMLLYKVTLNSQSGRFKTALNFVQSVLGLREGRENDKRYLQLLTHADTCVLWICLVHLMEFQTLPALLFNPANHNPGQIVSKDKLLIPWHSKRDLATPLEKLAEYLGHAVTLDLTQPLDLCTSPQYVQAVQNLTELLRSRKKYTEACRILQQVLQWAPHLEEVWLMLADVYAGCDSKDNAKQVLLDALASNPYSARLHYHYAMLEMSQGCHDEALEYMEQFVMSHFDASKDDISRVDPNLLFCKLLGLDVPVRKQLPALKDDAKDAIASKDVHLWLCYCLLLELQGETGEAVDVFEQALSSTTHAAQLATLWKSYVEFLYRRCQSCHPSALPAAQHQLQEAMFRSITTAPTLLPLPFPPQHSVQQQQWRDLSHVTGLVETYVQMVPPDSRTTTLQAFYDLMPDNIPLLIRCVETALADGQHRRARSLCTAAVYDRTANLQLWKLALALAQMEGTPKEVEQLYVRAVRAMPLSVSLWKDFLLFEVSQENAVAVQTILAQCQELGLNIHGYVATISAS